MSLSQHEVDEVATVVRLLRPLMKLPEFVETTALPQTYTGLEAELDTFVALVQEKDEELAKLRALKTAWQDVFGS